MIFGCTTKNEVIPAKATSIANAMDTIVAKMEFVPLTAKEISPAVKVLIKGKVNLALPQTFSTDSSDIHMYIGDLAISNTYLTWGEKFKNSALEDTAKLRSIALLDKVNHAELKTELSFIENNDSLEVYLNNYLGADSVAHLQAYYEAISWLENLYITLNFSDKISNKKEYNALILSQLSKGDELLYYLYDFQDYPPVSEFSSLMLDIIVCRNTEIDVKQLKELVSDLRQHSFQIEP